MANVTTNVTTNGNFIVEAKTLLGGVKCPGCIEAKADQKNALAAGKFIEAAKVKYGGKYEYSLVNYRGKSTKVKIKCHEHGIFEITPTTHLSGKACIKCRGKVTREIVRRKNKAGFLQDVKKIYGERYDYSSMNYRNSFDRLTIKCSFHGEFKISPYEHVTKEKGCPKCEVIEYKRVCEAFSFANTIKFFKEAKKRHGNKYNYFLTKYLDNATKIKIICPDHGVFDMHPTNHLSGEGCLKCDKIGRRKNKKRAFCIPVRATAKVNLKTLDFSEVGVLLNSMYYDNNLEQLLGIISPSDAKLYGIDAQLYLGDIIDLEELGDLGKRIQHALKHLED